MRQNTRELWLSAAFAAACVMLIGGCSQNGVPGLASADEIAAPQGQPPEATTPVAKRDSAVEAAKGNWPIFRGDPSSTGVSGETLPDKLSLLWKYRVPEGAFEGTAAIVNDVVYIGDLDGKVYALKLKPDGKDGELIWEYATESGFIASPAYRNGLLYIGDIDGRLHCIDTVTGTLKWGFETQAQIDSSANFYKDQVLVGSQDATLYCLNAQTGKLAWKHQINDQIRCTPTVVESRAFLAGCDGKLHVIDLDAGKELADVEIEAPTGVTPAVRGDFVYFGTEGGEFFCINWKTAKVVWTYADANQNQPYRSSAAAAEKTIIVGSRAKRVVALNPADGEVQWTFAAKQRVDSSPVIVGQRAFVGSADGRLYALDVASGQAVWEYDAGSGFTGSPAVAQERLVIASDRGVVYCFGKK